MRSRLAAALEWLCLAFAMVGGVVLLALVVITVISISGRALVGIGARPIPGDFELVEAGTAFAIFCFLPWCQFHRGHVTVDILAPWLGPRRDALLEALHNLVMLAVAVLIAWRLWYGMLDKIRYNETSFILQFPYWWGYAACMAPAVLYILVSGFTIARSLGDATRARRAGGA